jgi:tRNA uridine 5-carboxymethylaminomethyl modification enzyme
LLREDNADLRLTPVGRELGLVDDARWAAFETKREAIEQEGQRLRDTLLRPGAVDVAVAEQVLGQPLNKEAHLDELLRRPDVTYAGLMTLEAAGEAVADPVVAEQVEIQTKYSGYIARQKDEIARQQQKQGMPLPDDLDYSQVSGLSIEVCQKLTSQRPTTVGQASRMSGVTPAAISLLLVHLKKRGLAKGVQRASVAAKK